MRTVRAGAAQAGDVLAAPAVNDKGREILPKGARLSAAVLSRLDKWGIAVLTIEGAADPEGDPDDGDTAQESATAEADPARLQALEHRFRHCEDDPVMMRIKAVARRHLARAGD